MPPRRYHIRFSGSLLPGTDPLNAQRQLQARFGLSDEVIAKLFSGRTVTIKRDVDEASAARYRERFRELGALLQLIPVTPAGLGDDPAGHAPAPHNDEAHREPQPATPQTGPGTSRLTLAPAGALLEEAPRGAPRSTPDLSHLSLVPGSDWTLEDCAPATPMTPPPNTDHLTLEPRPAAPDDPDPDDELGSPHDR
jgi:hypothetical protein